MQHRANRGESLIEIVITVVIVGITVSALLMSLGTTGTSAQFQRTSVDTNTVMRNYAEATKAAARSCSGSTTTYTPGFDPPSGFTTSATPADGVCPEVGASRSMTLAVTGPTGITQTMQIVIRTP